MGRRDVSPAHWGNKGRQGRPRTLTEVNRERAPLPSTRTSPAEKDRKFAHPSNPLLSGPPKGELGWKEALTLVWGHAIRGKRQRCPISCISQAARGEGTVSGEMAKIMGLCHDTSRSWRVGDTMSSFSSTPG